MVFLSWRVSATVQLCEPTRRAGRSSVMSQVDDYLSPELEACLNNAGQCVRSRGCPLVILCVPFTAAVKAFRNSSSTPHRPCVQKESYLLVLSACPGAALLMACLGREHISAARAGQREGPGAVRAAELFPHGPPRGSPALCPTRALQRTNRQWSTRPLVRSRRSREAATCTEQLHPEQV